MSRPWIANRSSDELIQFIILAEEEAKTNSNTKQMLDIYKEERRVRLARHFEFMTNIGALKK